MTSIIIYPTTGRAKEYCEYSANLYRGCDHGCLYCYAPLVLHCDREKFYSPIVRPGAIEKFEKEAKALKGQGVSRKVLLSFTTDPYHHLDEEIELTRKAIKILHENGQKVSILTKGGKRSLRDLDLFCQHPELSEYGATLVFIDENQRGEIEPGAAPTLERIECLKTVHDKGVFTYVSLEPVWDPDQTLKLIELSSPHVDFFKIGTLNYHPRHKEIDYTQFLHDVKSLMANLGIEYYIKNDLRSWQEGLG